MKIRDKPEPVGDDELGTLRWFGEPWPSVELRAPVCEDERAHVAVPLELSCVSCGGHFISTDQGITMPYFNGTEVDTCAYHLACWLVVIGVPPRFRGDNPEPDGGTR